ncbi:DUF1007 family protein [Mangrovicella endophytica]|uniref:DUF1007 family protein n=1 Tax=Mangrovicella endophytica TaxID=2066697 RepID=UPI000C9E85A5|nr:DUF1007 family protein [Mangrovicella endophytica]
MSLIRRRMAGGLAFAAMLCAAAPALAHPHVFAESHMEIVGSPDGKLHSVRNVWRMDELFSSTVLVDFDKNKNGSLDDDELTDVGKTIRESIAEWSFYTFVRSGGRTLKMKAPDEIRTLYRDGQLLIFFEMLADEPIDLKTPLTVSNFDDTFYVAFDFADANAFQLVDMPQGCSKQLVVPDEDEAAQEWVNSIAGLGPDEKVPDDGVDYSQILATRAEVKCG